jgi:hypothetical protein
LAPASMKKNGKPNGARGVRPEAAEDLRNRKTYLNRLEEMGLDEPPAIKRGKMPSAMELARLAAELAKDSTSQVSARELAARAREIWKAAADAPFVEEMAGFVVEGLCFFDKRDWTRHCLALIGLLDETEGAAPGRRSSERRVRSIRGARMAASIAVGEIWRGAEPAVRGEEVIRAIFAAKSETEESRRKKLVELLEFARGNLSVPRQEAWVLKYGTMRVEATLVAAWMPLTLPPEDAQYVHVAAKAWMDLPEKVEVSNLGASPVLARWLAVLRMQQLKEAKIRLGKGEGEVEG